MDFGSEGAESHSLRGAIDVTKLDAFRDAFLAIEPLASARIDDRVDPRELRLTIPYGLGDADRTVFTVRWTTAGDYNVHYSDSAGCNLRWDRHPHDFSHPSDERHFHPHPDATAEDDCVETSSIETTQIVLVARAVHLSWRSALENESIESMNAGRNPPEAGTGSGPKQD
ncbi:MAG: hypothetical protein ACOCY6_02190 [Halodesulfurarchaeum sp.]